MGYASTIPFIGVKSNIKVLDTTHLTLSTVASDFVDMYRFKTLNYTNPISDAYLTLICSTRRDSSGSNNYYDAGSSGYVEIGALPAGIPSATVGVIPDEAFWTPANATGYGEYRIDLENNVASIMQPNTTYAVALRDWKSKFDNLYLYGMKIELSIYGNI